jgi:hypothetical protein
MRDGISENRRAADLIGSGNRTYTLRESSAKATHCHLD